MEAELLFAQLQEEAQSDARCGCKACNTMCRMLTSARISGGTGPSFSG